VVLLFIGAKMLLMDVYKMPVAHLVDGYSRHPCSFHDPVARDRAGRIGTAYPLCAQEIGDCRSTGDVSRLPSE
jgi:hypothetical protein